MPPFLKVKTAGLPRWAWALALTGAVGIGLYLRSRSATREVETEDGERLEYLSGTEPATGLAAAGLIGPAAGTVTPVEAPYLPEGFVDVFGSLTELAGDLGAYITTRQETESNNATEVLTGGGAPTEPVDHTPAVAPAPSCPANVVNAIRKDAGEINRLQGEINQLQAKIATLTQYIQQHPKANKRGQWERERNQARGSIEAKRAKVAALHAAQVARRAVPGCAGVKV